MNNDYNEFTGTGANIKGMARIILVLGLIGDAFMFFKAVDDGSDILLIIAVVGVLSTLISYFVLGAFGDLVDSNQRLCYLTSEVLKEIRSNKSSKPENYSNSKPTYLSNPTAGSAGGKWRCPECEEMNPTSSRVCKGCGYEK